MVYLAAWDLNTNTLITQLTVQSYTWSIRLNDAGEFSMKMNLTDAQVKQQAAVILGLNGNPFKVTVSSDAYTILYSGIAWKVSRASGSSQMTVAGKALTSYFQQVVLTTSYSEAVYPSGVSPAVLVETVVNDIQAQAGANIWITPVLNLNSPPPPMHPNYQVTQYVTAAQVLADMAAATIPGTGGVDYYMNDIFESHVPVHRMMIAAPRAGRDQTQSRLVLSLPTALNWTWDSDAQASGNQVIVVGAGSGSTQIRSIQDSNLPRGGLGQMPLMQVVEQYSQIPSATQLDGVAHGALNLYQKPVTTPTVTLSVTDPVLPLGAYQIGDDVLVTCPPNPWFPSGLNEWWRIAAFTVTYPDEGVGTQKLTLNRPPIF